MKDKVINNLFGKELVTAMKQLLMQFYTLKVDVPDIIKSFKGINESVRVGIYLLALERGHDELAFKINKANKIINQQRKEDFLDAYKNKKVDKFLALLGKSDKISLMSDLEIDVPLKERGRLSKKQKDFYKIISNSIMEDQENDKRDSVNQFIKYKKEE